MVEICWIATGWVSPTWANGATGKGYVSASARDLAASTAPLAEKVIGTGH